MEGVARAEVVGDVPVFADLQIVPHKLFVVGMHAVFDYGQCSLSRAFPSQVGHALLRDDYFHVVVAVVNVCHHRDDRRYPSPFLGGGAEEYRIPCVAAEIAGASDAVHHVGAVDVGGVDESVDVAFKGCVHGYQTETAHHLRMVGNLAGTHQQLSAIEVDVVHKL